MIKDKKVKYLTVDEDTTIEQLAEKMMKEHKKGYIAKAIFHGIHFSTEHFQSKQEIIDYYNNNHSIMLKIKKKIIELQETLKEDNTVFQQTKDNIDKSIDYLDFTNPNTILEWFSNTCYYTNLIDMNDTVIKLLGLLRNNDYLSFDEIIDTHILYDEETIPRYLIGQVITCLEEISFISEILIDFIDDYVDNLHLENKTNQKLPFNRFHNDKRIIHKIMKFFYHLISIQER